MMYRHTTGPETPQALGHHHHCGGDGALRPEDSRLLGPPGRRWGER